MTITSPAWSWLLGAFLNLGALTLVLLGFVMLGKAAVRRDRSEVIIFASISIPFALQLWEQHRRSCLDPFQTEGCPWLASGHLLQLCGLMSTFAIGKWAEQRGRSPAVWAMSAYILQVSATLACMFPWPWLFGALLNLGALCLVLWGRVELQSAEISIDRAILFTNLCISFALQLREQQRRSCLAPFQGESCPWLASGHLLQLGGMMFMYVIIGWLEQRKWNSEVWAVFWSISQVATTLAWLSLPWSWLLEALLNLGASCLILLGISILSQAVLRRDPEDTALGLYVSVPLTLQLWEQHRRSCLVPFQEESCPWLASGLLLQLCGLFSMTALANWAGIQKRHETMFVMSSCILQVLATLAWMFPDLLTSWALQPSTTVLWMLGQQWDGITLVYNLTTWTSIVVTVLTLYFGKRWVGRQGHVTFATSNYKRFYNKQTECVEHQHEVFQTLKEFLLCFAQARGFSRESAKKMFTALNKEMLQNVQSQDLMNEVERLAVRFWTSAVTQGFQMELCHAINDVLRKDDAGRLMELTTVLARTINQHLVGQNRVTMNATTWPPNMETYRGSGMPEAELQRYRSFLGKKFRCPPFVATSYNRDTAKDFMWQAVAHNRMPVLFTFKLHPQRKCIHARYIAPVSHVTTEAELLFVPYSTFEVIGAIPPPSPADYWRIELNVMPDNSQEAEDLPLFFWM